MDFDEDRMYYSRQNLRNSRNRNNLGNDDDDDDDDGGGDNDNNREEDQRNEESDDKIEKEIIRRHFREFLRCYHQDNRYIYREKLNRMHRRNLPQAKLTVDLSHVSDYDPHMLGLLILHPSHYLAAMELGAQDALKTLTYDQHRTNLPGQNDADDDDDDNDNHNNQTMEHTNGETTQQGNNDKGDLEEASTQVQVLLKGHIRHTHIRDVNAGHMNRLIKCPGMVISTSHIKSRATELLVRCSKCLDQQRVPVLGGPFSNASLPADCKGPDAQACGRYPYSVVPDESLFCDRQTWKLQESPESVPTGEMPRSILLAVERSLVDRAPPGTRCSVLCIPSLLSTGQQSVKSIFLKVVGMDTSHSNTESATFTPEEEAAFLALAKRSDVYDILWRSVAPSIKGDYSVDVKKAMLCMLMGGTRKRLPDGINLRGDINVLLLGDPSTGKSQFLKFASQVSPIGVYTSGKGSSAAGLTASVIRDARGEFYLEGGAMVLADGGVVCIDEFDKMRAQDRVAIHEAMEQQTISVAKAGITTVLNSRASVLAAANPVFGRYDELKSAAEQIDLMTTILSRFDLIFLVRDFREEARDRQICQHVMGVHMNNSTGGITGRTVYDGSDDGDTNNEGVLEEATAEEIADSIVKVAQTGEGELSVSALKKYIQYAKAKCTPCLTEETGNQLASKYVQIREGVRKRTFDGSMKRDNRRDDDQNVIPITVRQLEALVRLAESLARIRLDSDVRQEDVQEAIRLFTVSTMAASTVDSQDKGLSGADVERCEEYLRRRVAQGSTVNKMRLVEEAAAQGYNAIPLTKAIHVMTMRGEVQERNQGRLIKRVK